MEEPSLRPDEPIQPTPKRDARWGLLLINLPWLFVLLAIWWLVR